MAQLVAVLDTSVVVFLSTSTPPEDRASFTRWRRVHTNALTVFQRYAKVIIPTPVITELHAGGDDGVKIAMSLAAQVRRLRVAGLELDAALEAGKRIRETLQKRPPELRRNALKFDALILGVAVAEKADAILTTDGSDFAKLLAVEPALNVPQIIYMDQILKGQLTLPEVDAPANVVDIKKAKK